MGASLHERDGRSTEHLRLLEGALDQVDDIVFITEARSTPGVGRRIVFVNHAFERVTGWQMAEVLGRGPGITVGEVTERDALARIEARLALGRAVHEELTKCRKDGTAYRVDLRITPIRDGSGEITHWLSVQREISQRAEVRERMTDTDRLAALGTLASGVAHEVNNPLTWVLSNLEYARDELSARGDDPQAGRLVAAVDDALVGVERVRSIVRDLMTFASPRRDALAPVDLRAVVERALRVASFELRRRAVVELELGAAPLVMGSESGLGQVALNLLLNAAQAADPARTAPLRVVVRTRTDDEGNAALEVSDNGVGIPPWVGARVFEPFYTTKPVGVGCGLGLFVCRGIVARCGGSIGYESDGRSGTRFRVTLPPAPASASVSATPPAIAELRRGRVAIVDDEPAICLALRRLLGGPHAVEVFASAAEFLARARSDSGDFDLVLCDVVMPGMSGVELFHLVAQERPAQAERFVFVTAAVLDGETRRFLDDAPVPWFEKPIDARRLRALLHTRLGA